MNLEKALDSLTNYYKDELSCYQRLVELGRRQNELISDEEFDSLEGLLNNKQEIIEKVNKIEENLLPYKEYLAKELKLDKSKWFLDLLRNKIISNKLTIVMNKIINLLKELKELDQLNQKDMRLKRNKVLKEVNKVKQGSKINNSYNQKVRIHSTFIDDKS